MHLALDDSRLPWILASALGLTLLFVARPDAAALDSHSTDPQAILSAALNTQAPDRTLARLKMTIRDHGAERVRVFSVRSKRFSDARKTLWLIEAPAEVRDTGFLTVSYNAGHSNEQWIYLPKLHRVSRVASSGRADSFVGSDFSISDLSLSSQKSEDFELKLLDPADQVGSEECWVLEAKPRGGAALSELGYERMQLWISKSKLIVLQFKASLPDGKRTKYLKAMDIRSEGGVWTAHKIQMRTLEGTELKSETVLEYLSIDNEAKNLNDSDFTQQRLEQGA